MSLQKYYFEFYGEKQSCVKKNAISGLMEFYFNAYLPMK